MSLEENIAKDYGISFSPLPDLPGWSRAAHTPSLLRFLGRICFVVRGFFAALRMIKSIQPAFVLASGSYTSCPVLCASLVAGIPYYLHEQNVVLGRTNAWFARFAKKVFLSFPLKEPYLKNLSLVTVGNPLRAESLEDNIVNKDSSALPESKASVKRILVMGGSQGAERLNSLFLDCLDYMMKDKTHQYHIMHLTGSKDCNRVKEYYKSYSVEAEIYDFYQPMRELYRKADLVIARAGGTSLAELAFWGRPLILVPISRSVNQHQNKNAEYFASQGAAIVLDENMESGLKLFDAIRDILDDPSLFQKMTKNIRRLARTNAGSEMARVINQRLDLHAS